MPVAYESERGSSTNRLVLRAAQFIVLLSHLGLGWLIYVVVVDASYPDPPLSDARVCLREWSMSDLDCVAMASSDPRIPAGTTVPAEFTPDNGRAFIERSGAAPTMVRA